MRIFSSILFFVACFAMSTSIASAANLYLDPGIGTYAAGNTFSVKVRIDPQEDCINAATVLLDYPEELVRAVDVARGDSILTLWPVAPEINVEKGTVEFAGGLPGGYCGRIDGDPGFTNVLAEIIFQVPGFTIGGADAATDGKIVFMEGTEVLLNDGRGTPAQLFVQDALFSIGPPGTEGVQDNWFDSIRDDDVRPEPFSIELVQDDSVYGGKWFIAFSTQDKQSGIDRYEVYETDIDNEGYVRNGKEGEESRWATIESPYKLEDQSLNSIIRVRAIDKAGNERIAGKIPDESLRKNTGQQSASNYIYFIVAGGVLLIVLLAVFLIRRKKKLKERDILVSNEEKSIEQRSEVVVDDAVTHTEGNEYDDPNKIV